MKNKKIVAFLSVLSIMAIITLIFTLSNMWDIGQLKLKITESDNKLTEDCRINIDKTLYDIFDYYNFTCEELSSVISLNVPLGIKNDVKSGGDDYTVVWDVVDMQEYYLVNCI